MRLFKFNKKRNFNESYTQNPQSYPQGNAPNGQQNNNKKHIPKLDAETAYSFKGKMQSLIAYYSVKYKLNIPQYVFAFNINLKKQGYYINVVRTTAREYLVEFNPDLAIESKEELKKEIAQRVVFKLNLLAHGHTAKEKDPYYIGLCDKYHVFNYNGLPETPYTYFLMRCRVCREPFYIFTKRPSQKNIDTLLQVNLPYHRGQDYAKSDKVHSSQLSQSQEELTNSQAQFYFERMEKIIKYNKRIRQQHKDKFKKDFLS